MRWFSTLVLGLSLWGPSGLAWGGEALQNFASELKLHESRQLLRPERVVNYSDAEGGASLRALLAPARVTRVLDDYFSGLGKDNTQPNFLDLVGPLVTRYGKAFAAEPRVYEEEYLDSLHLVVAALERSANRTQLRLAATAPADAEAMRPLLDSLQGMSDSMVALTARTIRDRANSGVYSPAGQARALALADRLTASVPPERSRAPGLLFPPPADPPLQSVPAREVTPADIEETFKRYPLDSAGALDQMQQCEPRMTRVRYEELLANDRTQDAVKLLGFNAGSTRVAVFGPYWTCVKLSPTGYVVLPVEALRQTVTTVGAGPAALSNWRRQILAELAMNGKANTLVGRSTGYASHVTYTLTRSPPSLAYEARSLPPGSFRREDYNAVLLTPDITSTVVIQVGPQRVKNAAALFAPVGRLPLTADGYVAIAGSATTASTDFSGTVWKAESLQRMGDTLRLDPQGVATLRTESMTHTGQWKLAGQVLHVVVDADVRYSLALSGDGRFLDGDIRRAASPGERHDDADDDRRFKAPRFYKPTDTDYERTIATKREGLRTAAYRPSVAHLFVQAETRKAQILSETAEKEAEEEARAATTPATWRSCDATLLAHLMSASAPRPAPEFAGRSVGEVCHAWLGSRKEWKATILQEGCRGRCQRY
jgi:hypothetical protein